MPIFPISEVELDLPRNLALLDTNVLIALFDKGDANYEDARYFLEAHTELVLGIAPPVIVEACGIFIGKMKRSDLAAEMLQWVITPGTGLRLLPAPHQLSEPAILQYLSADAGWMRDWRVDYVDAFLMQMAHQITKVCSLHPELVIVTKDSDFLRCRGKGYGYRIHNIVSDETL
ncbi:PIN domain-containing protein [Paracoccus pantotrophus]|uniref:PIN domain-containing protein n=1 Tax=Paracoccus pantotrophus TaxID=82367 RepID=UPI0009445F1B|nr:PIN domain-containing protein [Paracoccus pantotrophus]MDF3856598.1 PIN domain-containing protein [Paracoccus pantotrophus]